MPADCATQDYCQMFRKLPLAFKDSTHTNTPRRTTISTRSARTMLERELRDIRGRLLRLEEEVSGVIPIRRTPDSKAA